MSHSITNNDLKKSQIKAGGISAIASIGIMTTLLYFGADYFNRKIDTLEQTIENQDQYSFDTKEHFNREVFANIDSYVASKQQEEVQLKYKKYSAAADVTPKNKKIYGDLSARFTLVEFSDFECPFCKKFHNTPKEIVDSSGGNVNWQWLHLPLEFHNPVAAKEAEAAECIAEQKGNRGFWVFAEEIFKNTGGNGRGIPNLPALVEGVGADMEAFKDCMASGKNREIIAQQSIKARKLGINGTPATIIVDNQTGKTQLLSGAQPAEAIMVAIKKMVSQG